MRAMPYSHWRVATQPLSPISRDLFLHGYSTVKMLFRGKKKTKLSQCQNKGKVWRASKVNNVRTSLGMKSARLPTSVAVRLANFAWSDIPVARETKGEM